ncbi:short transient receptor potential channel 5-like [Convolutriloba macropyga]|uniref:short transient receptor potential channel 5-like n=1 Tax=Convolutriloba macropyga TaxID=536237 RepID=UPI003F522002
MSTKSGGLYPKGANCVMVASVNNNIDLLKVLTYYGAKPLPSPTFRVPSIFDVSSKRKNVLERGEAILYSMKALASPAYALVIASDDPLMSSFQMSQRCRYLAKMFPVLRDEFIKLSEQQEVFAAEWLGTAADNYEVNIVLALEDETDHKNKSRAHNKVHDPYARLNYALRHNHERFVSHPYVQQQLFKHFATGMPAQWYDRGATFQLLFLALLFFLCPVWTILYWFCPSGPKWHARLGTYLEIPIMKLILHVQFYISLLIAIIYNQNYLTPIDWFVGGNNVARFMHNQLQKAADVEITITPPLNAFNVYVFIWNFGNAYYEYKNFRHLGHKRYWTSMNVSNLLMTFFYMNTIALTLVMWTSGEENPTEPFYLDISNALIINAVLGKMFLIFKLVHWLKLNNTFGRTFYLAVAPLSSMGAFWFMAVLVLITFVIPINMLTSNSYVQIVELCEVADYRTLTINNVSIGQDRLENIASIECAEISDEDNPYHQRTIDELREFISLWAIGYRLLISLFGFDTQHRIVRLMGNYATRQEFLAAILIGVYIFIMVILRLNVLLALVVNTLSNIYSYLNTGFKFERTKVMMPFVDVTSTCWMPSPICMVPTLRYVWITVNKVFEKRKPDYSEPDPTKIMFRANQMEAERKRKNAAKRVVSEISVRMLRVVSARHREKPVSVDNLSDLKAMMSPRLNATARKTKRLEQDLFDLLQFRDPYLQLKKKY